MKLNAKLIVKRAAQVGATVSVMLAPAYVALAQLPQPPAPDGVRTGETTINQLITTVINWLLGIAFGIAVLFIVIGGFWYITSAGNEETAEKGRNTAINALIGVVIIILSYVAVQVVSRLVGTSGNITP